MKWLLVVFYVGSIFMANWFIGHVGTQFDPNGPHVIQVWPGIYAPSGVLWVGVALVLRDMVQFFLGRRVAVGAMLVGARPVLLRRPEPGAGERDRVPAQ